MQPSSKPAAEDTPEEQRNSLSEARIDRRSFFRRLGVHATLGTGVSAVLFPYFSEMGARKTIGPAAANEYDRIVAAPPAELTQLSHGFNDPISHVVHLAPSRGVEIRLMNHCEYLEAVARQVSEGTLAKSRWLVEPLKPNPHINRVVDKKGTCFLVEVDKELLIVSNDHILNTLPSRLADATWYSREDDIAVIAADFVEPLGIKSFESGVVSSLSDSEVDGRDVYLWGVGSKPLEVKGRAIRLSSSAEILTGCKVDNGKFILKLPDEDVNSLANLRGVSGAPVYDQLTGEIVGVFHSMQALPYLDISLFSGRSYYPVVKFSGPEALRSALNGAVDDLSLTCPADQRSSG